MIRWHFSMAHNIHYNETTQRHSFFSVHEKPWHGLGKIVSEYPTSKEALEFAGLNYDVVKRDLYTHDGEVGKGLDFLVRDIKIADHQATIRTDTNEVLGIVGKDYQVVQNTDAFSFFDSIVGGDGIQYETAGALGKGERIFITAKLPSYIKVGKDDLIDKYLFLTTSHDGYGAITAAFTPIRIVCNNTLNAALRNHMSAIKIRHTSTAKERLSQAHMLMGISNKLSEQMEEIFNHWSKVRISDDDAKKLIKYSLAPNRELIKKFEYGEDEGTMSAQFGKVYSQAVDYAMGSESQLMETTQGTVFGLYNGITGYFQNVREYKNPEAKLKSLLLGGTAQLRTQRAFDICEGFAAKGMSAFKSN